MISQIEVTGNKYEVDENTKKYAIKHIGKLDKYLPRHAKKSASSSNVLAAIDIVEAKLDGQIRRYKTEKNPRLGKSGIMAKFKRSFKRG